MQSQRIACLTFYNTNTHLENYGYFLEENGRKFSYIFWKNIKFSGKCSRFTTLWSHSFHTALLDIMLFKISLSNNYYTSHMAAIINRCIVAIIRL